VKNKQEIKQLLEKHLKRELSVPETNELFDGLRTIHRPEELDTYFHSRWNVDRPIDVRTDLDWEDILEENQRRLAIRSATVRRARVRKLWQWGVAASVLLLVSLVWWNWDAGSDYITYKTGFGETKNIVLDDGTTVILNANSELSWITDWNKDKARYALLQGEAYFKVAHIDLETGSETLSSNLSERMPFQVKTTDVVIDVLGTTFNVSDRRGETQVYLEEGSVQLGLLTKEISQNKTKNNTRQNRVEEKSKPVKTVLMKPGESIGYSAKTGALERDKSEDMESLTQWKDGSLVYHNVLFGDMLDHMEDIYGKEFEVQDKELLEKHLNFGVPYENWETVKKLMERTLGVEIIPGAGNKTIIKKRKE